MICAMEHRADVLVQAGYDDFMRSNQDAPPERGRYTAEPGARQNAGMAAHTLPLREDDLAEDPLNQFATWQRDARAAGVREPEAAALATASAVGAPSVRMVLVKSFDEHGFVFYSNYASRKGLELAENPRASLLFHWDQLGRQVRIEGPVRHTGTEESAAYFATRPRGSQLSALASPQSEVIANREALEEMVGAVERRQGDAPLPLPDAWGGFRLNPESIEFWQQRADRLHDRLRYERDGGGWRVRRLAP
jgi:pyridoxamine 5'-phosphate oxidase